MLSKTRNSFLDGNLAYKKQEEDRESKEEGFKNLVYEKISSVENFYSYERYLSSFDLITGGE